MGWVNYIIVPKLKLMVTVSRSVDENIDFLKGILTKDDDTLYDIEEKPCVEITVLDLQRTVEATRALLILREANWDKFLLFWLSQQGIDYTVVSEHKFYDDKNLQELTKDFLKIDVNEEETDSNYVLGEED